jgi:hypothetical protein
MKSPAHARMRLTLFHRHLMVFSVAVRVRMISSALMCKNVVTPQLAVATVKALAIQRFAIKRNCNQKSSP